MVCVLKEIRRYRQNRPFRRGYRFVGFQGSYTAVVVAGGMGGHNGPLNSVEILPLTKSLSSDGY